MSDDICGEEKNDGNECTYSPKYPDGKCGHHTEHDTANSQDDGRKSMLEKNPEIVDLIGDEIERGATISEALSEICEKTGVYIARSTHDNWMAAGKRDDGKSVEQEYRSEVRRARERAKRDGRESIIRQAVEKGDTRTLLEVHKMQYGDLYGDESDSEDKSVPFAVPEELIDEWQQLTHPQ